jgi:hypothetical protein
MRDPVTKFGQPYLNFAKTFMNGNDLAILAVSVVNQGEMYERA